MVSEPSSKKALPWILCPLVSRSQTGTVHSITLSGVLRRFPEAPNERWQFPLFYCVLMRVPDTQRVGGSDVFLPSCPHFSDCFLGMPFLDGLAPSSGSRACFFWVISHLPFTVVSLQVWQVLTLWVPSQRRHFTLASAVVECVLAFWLFLSWNFSFSWHLTSHLHPSDKWLAWPTSWQT